MTKRLDLFAIKADSLGCYTVQSNVRGLLYVYSDGEYAIVTPETHIRLTDNELKTAIAELHGMMNDVSDLERMGVKKIPKS